MLLLGFAGVIAGGHAACALAQAGAPLRVDPALLGLPPLKPADAAPGAASAEVGKIETPVVEQRPATPLASSPVVATPAAPAASAPVAAVPPEAVRPSAGAPANAPAPASAASAPARVPAPAPARVVTPAPASVPVPAPAPAVSRPSLAVPARPAPAPAPAASAGSSVELLRVDPALLGLSPAEAAAQEAPRGAPVATMPSASGGMQLARASLARKKPDERLAWYQRLWAPVQNVYDNGSLELYLPFYTYHLRSRYPADKIATYQEKPKGFGVGRGAYNEKGDWEGVYALAFQDSHFKPMYMAGYGWQSIWRPAEDLRLGLGYVAGLMSRTDIFNYVPFPIILPAASVSYRNFSLNGAFVPGGRGWGNVAFFWAKWELGKEGERIGTPARPAPVEESEPVMPAFGVAVPLAKQRVPYGPVVVDASGGLAIGGATGLAATSGGTAVGGVPGTAATGVAPAGVAPGGLARPVAGAGAQPPQVAATGPRDEEAVSDPAPALKLRAARSMTPPPKSGGDTRLPLFLRANRMGGDVDREFTAEGDAELRKVGTVVNAEQLTYWPVEDEVEANGNVRLDQEQNVITGPRMRMRLGDQTGYFDEASYLLKNQPRPNSREAAAKAFAEEFLEKQNSADYWNSGFAMPRAMVQNFQNLPNRARTYSDGRGESERIDFEGENHYLLTNNKFTTCSPGNDDWYLKTRELKLDYDAERGEGKDGTVYFKGVPLFYSPWLPFSLNKQRKSGLLAPTFGSTTTSGLSLAVPYYWDIAPNMDATITTRAMLKRGLQVNTDFRYLNQSPRGQYSGEARVELLPSDSAKNGDSRYGITWMHRQATANGFGALINFNKVSDGTYFTDLSSLISQTAQTQLPQQAVLSYGGGGWWNATANFQQYQTLQPDPANPVAGPYRMLPQLTFNARKPDLFGTDSIFMGQYTAFSKPQQIINGVKLSDPNAQRLVLYPQVSMPYVQPGWYVTPKLGMNIRHYSLSRQASGIPSSIDSVVPVGSVDSGMVFERPSNWFGRDYTQTLEPRLYYVNIPYRNQDNIPIFDASLADFNFAQIFAENQFTGWDRINNVNQLTAAATSRLIDLNTGAEIIRVMIGQRFHFARNRVSLSANTLAAAEDRSWDKSDFLSAFSGQILPKVYLDLAMQYNPTDQKFKRQSAGLRFMPEPGKVLNAAYRYNADPSAPTNQVDFAGQWPLTGRLYGVGRLNYSFKDPGSTLSNGANAGGRVIQAIAGLEYKGDCWVVRGVIQRQALTSSTVSSAFFVQLELNDFASVGSNPIGILRRNVQGYSLINESNTDYDYVQ